MPKPLFIISCSSTKVPDAGLLPAWRRYDGPAYRVLRRQLRERGPLDCRIAILSAEHGLIELHTPIADYDRRMDALRGAELAARPSELLTPGLIADTSEVYVFGGAVYRWVVALWELQWAAFGGRPIHYSSGGIGTQLKQLKGWLEGVPA
jgi:hypothetical protein